MTVDVRSKGVFFYDEPSIQTLKNCSLFWKNIVVFESYLSNVVENPSLVEISKFLFNKGILKIVHTPEGLKQALWNKIYTTLDMELREYLYKNSQKCVITPDKPESFDKIINESTKIDDADKNLQELIDAIVKLNTYKQWFEPAIEEASRYYYMPEEIHKKIFNQIKKNC